MPAPSRPDFRGGWGRGVIFRGVLLPPDVVAVQLYRALTLDVPTGDGLRALSMWLQIRDVGRVAEYLHVPLEAVRLAIRDALTTMKAKDGGGAWCDAEEKLESARSTPVESADPPAVRAGDAR